MGGAHASRAPLWAILALCAGSGIFHFIIVATSHIHLSRTPSFGLLFKLSFVSAAALTHWAIYCSLLLTFGATLRRNHVPLITALARRMHGELSGEMVRYTGQVTVAWTGFFAAQLALSVTLFFFAPLVVWSFFVNILDIPSVVLMFAAEYACRLRCLRDPPRHSFAAIMAMVADVRKPQPKTAASL
jgi:uncharacterized membrane protein